MLTFVVFEKSRCFSALQNLTLFQNFLQITSKYAQKHMIKKSEKLIHWKKLKSNKLWKWPKRGKNGCFFFGPGGPNFDPFFTIFRKSLLNMPKNIILKNQKISFTRKILSPKNCKNGQKRPKNGHFLALEV